MKRSKHSKQRTPRKPRSRLHRRARTLPRFAPKNSPQPEHAVLSSDPSQQSPRKVRRRRYKVESLPEDAQSQIFEGYISHTPYRLISDQLAARGIKISRQALCRYWRERWEEEFDFLRHARTCVLFIARALKQDPNGDLARLGRELLFAMVMQKAPFLKQRDPVTLLHEATAIDRSSPRSPKSRGALPEDSTLSEDDLGRRIRQVYGIPEPDQTVEEPSSHRGQKQKK
ncbi:MAG: phage protein Gp27 family protein [Candidatus Acidiferrales bacterium]